MFQQRDGAFSVAVAATSDATFASIVRGNGDGNVVVHDGCARPLAALHELDDESVVALSARDGLLFMQLSANGIAPAAAQCVAMRDASALHWLPQRRMLLVARRGGQLVALARVAPTTFNVVAQLHDTWFDHVRCIE